MFARSMVSVGLVSIALVAGACGGGGSTDNSSTASSPSAAPVPSGAIVVNMTDSPTPFRFAPAALTTAAGSAVFFVTNKGQTLHNFTIRDASGKVLGKTNDLQAGESQTVTVTLTAGSFDFVCTIPGHLEAGMKGTLTVS